MNDNQVDKILGNAKMSMEMEGFTIDLALEEVGRKILTGEININDYIAQVKLKAMGYAYEV